MRLAKYSAAQRALFSKPPTELINELVELRNKGIITNDEFTVLVNALGIKYIESEINEKINDALMNKLYPNLNSGAAYV